MAKAKEFFKGYSREQGAQAFFEMLRWPRGVECPFCRRQDKIYNTVKPQPYYCGTCRKAFSAKVGTLMASSAVPMTTWLEVMYAVVLEPTLDIGAIARKLHLRHNTCRDMIHRIMAAWSINKDIKDLEGAE